MKLYRLTTKGLGDYWVVAKDPTDAETKLKHILDSKDYGFTDGRKVTTIEVIAEEIVDRFMKDKRLIL